MFWHIFKKDCKLTWPLVVGVALLHFLARITQFKIGHFGGNPALGPLLNLLREAGYLTSILLIAVVVHQDPIPGSRQDWLVRPIWRRDLLLAKLVFVLLLVQGPMLAADVFHSLLDGFSFQQSVTASLSRAFFLFFAFYLPGLTFAALTANFAQAIVAGVMIFLGGFSIGLLINVLFFGGRLRPPVEFSGLAWIDQSERALLALAIGVAILGLQYFRRKTELSRYLFGAGVFIWVGTLLTPWAPAFAMQKRFSPHAGSAKEIQIAFDPSVGKLPAVMATNLDSQQRFPRDNNDMLVGLPLRIGYLAPEALLKSDHSEIKIAVPGGKSVNIGTGDDFEVHGDDAVGSSHQLVRIPGDIFEHVKDVPATLEIHYSFTLLHASQALAMPALAGNQRSDEVGWCKTRVNDARTAVLMACLTPGNAPACARVFLENNSTHQHNPIRSACSMNYAPYVDTFDGDAVSRFGFLLPFRDASGLAQYPVDGRQLADAQVFLRLYRPVDHFSRDLVIPSVRLSDWVAQ
jgi:hypothetical protein